MIDRLGAVWPEVGALCQVNVARTQTERRLKNHFESLTMEACVTTTKAWLILPANAI